MKLFIAAVVSTMLMLFAGSAAYAQTAPNTVTGHSTSSSGSNSGAVINQVTNSTPNLRYSGSYTMRNVPALGSIIVSPTASCMGSYGAQAAAAGFGFGIGGTIQNSTCNKLEQIRTAWNIGQHVEASMMMCQFKSYRDSRALLGQPCPAFYYHGQKPPAQEAEASPSDNGMPVTAPPSQAAALGVAPARTASASPDPMKAPAPPVVHRTAMAPAPAPVVQQASAPAEPAWKQKLCSEPPTNSNNANYDYYCKG